MNKWLNILDKYETDILIFPYSALNLASFVFVFDFAFAFVSINLIILLADTYAIGFMVIIIGLMFKHVPSFF